MSNLRLVVKRSFLNEFVHVCVNPSTAILNLSLTSPPCPLFVPVSPGPPSSPLPSPVLQADKRQQARWLLLTLCLIVNFHSFWRASTFWKPCSLPQTERGWSWVQKGPQGSRDVWDSLSWDSRLLLRGTVGKNI